MKITTNSSGIAWLMKVGMIRSEFPLAMAARDVFPSVFQKYRLVSGPTVYAAPVVIRMNSPPTGMARLSALLSSAVMNLTTSWGCASTPRPTPMIMVVTRTSQNSEPSSGMDIQPVKPLPTMPSIMSDGTFDGSAARSLNAWTGPPSSESVRNSSTAIPRIIITPCMASVYMTALSPPKIT